VTAGLIVRITAAAGSLRAAAADARSDMAGGTHRALHLSSTFYFFTKFYIV